MSVGDLVVKRRDMSACSFDPYIIPDYSPDYLIVVSHLRSLGVELSSDEISEMEESRDLSFEFAPMSIAKFWYNVRVECDNYSIIDKSNHKGFKY